MRGSKGIFKAMSRCDHCDNKKVTLQCSRVCDNVLYCSDTCKRAAWIAGHNKTCASVGQCPEPFDGTPLKLQLEGQFESPSYPKKIIIPLAEKKTFIAVRTTQDENSGWLLASKVNAWPIVRIHRCDIVKKEDFKLSTYFGNTKMEIKPKLDQAREGQTHVFVAVVDTLEIISGSNPDLMQFLKKEGPMAIAEISRRGIVHSDLFQIKNWGKRDGKLWLIDWDDAYTTNVEDAWKKNIYGAPIDLFVDTAFLKLEKLPSSTARSGFARVTFTGHSLEEEPTNCQS